MKSKSGENEYGKIEIVRLLTTHYATKGFIKKAKREWSNSGTEF